ncbi:phosphoadenosine phosphosulfate reductase domain-containing protein [Selenihalanaerobacter shriftii]|uniref:Phosphoadenosine phosphosulfate reductase n=1 Tax=Selenihalanaerobacter shriftii TaxID=142842 RepID=A0A1T4NEY6_9FIRM|nr:phosphoadenosine phosphosulfate reductase family protein [Selenihalanaerobacter shriftii]SJZ77636.1 phosphoadenosine phosphosulfate reductase [Selenihalanaerobacter shriftii]
MQIFWCKNCEVPILYTANKNNNKVKFNPYFDLEDEGVEEVLEQGNPRDYSKLLDLKSIVNQAIKNKRSKDSIEEIFNRIQNKIYGEKCPQYIKEIAIKYADYKMHDLQNFEEDSKEHTCPECGTKVHYISKDIRPVFMEERIMLSILLEEDLTEENIWNGAGNRYIINGESSDIVISELYEVDNLDEKIIKIQKRVKGSNKKIDFSKFIEVNKDHFNYIDKNAIDFIKRVKKVFKQRLSLVSFSGGKDSTVVSDLVTRALNTQDVLHVFGDTTLEFPYTYEYVQRLKERPKRPPFLPVDTSNQDFMELSNQFGPPTRVMRWCCTIFKTGPIGKLFRQIAGQQKILTFYGVRRSESISRSNYDKITESPKISKQLVISPIVDWHDADVWLYLLTRGIDFNYAYRLGFARVGCWCCPNNSKWSEFLCKIFMEERSREWRDFLIEFSKKIGKPDPEVYVDTGKWKARQGGAGVNTGNIKLEAKPCGLGDNAKNYDLKRPINEGLYEFFKPFGIINKELGDEMLGEVYILDYKTKEPRFKLQGNLGKKQLKVQVLQDKYVTLLFQRIECQLRKYQFCVNCSACANVCAYDAIDLKDGYQIDETNCVRCMECIAHFNRGCLITKTMKIKGQ